MELLYIYAHLEILYQASKTSSVIGDMEHDLTEQKWSAILGE